MTITMNTRVKQILTIFTSMSLPGNLLYTNVYESMSYIKPTKPTTDWLKNDRPPTTKLVENTTKTVNSEPTWEAKSRLQAQQEAQKWLSKCLNDKCINQDLSWLVQTIQNCCEKQEHSLNKSTIKFGLTKEDLTHNKQIFINNDYDYSKIVSKDKDTVLTPGSEFRSIKTIEQLFGHHSDWKDI